MSARTAPVLIVALLTALLAGGCGGGGGQAESPREPSRGTSALNGARGSLDHRPSPAHGEQAAAPGGEGRARSKAVLRSSPGAAQAPPVQHHSTLRAIERILAKTSPGDNAAGERRRGDTIEKIVDQARKEGVRVIESGSDDGGGIAQILQQLESDNP